MNNSESHFFMRELLHARARANGIVMTIRITSDPVDALYWMLPALAHLSHTDRWSVWLTPPFRLESTCFENMGFNLTHTRIVHRSGAHGCGLSLVEQALRCPANAVILAWPQRCQTNDVSLLQRAAHEGGSLGLLFLSDEIYAEPATCKQDKDLGFDRQLKFDMNSDLASHCSPS